MAEGPAGSERQTVAVVGGGIAGLCAAWQLTGGAAGADASSPVVVVLEGSGRLGGKLDTARVGDRTVDVGPDGFLGRRPEATALCLELGLGDHLEPIGASGAAVWARGRRRPLPDGIVLGVPTRFLPVARSGILGPVATLRLLRDLVAPRPDVRGPLGDRAIGPLIANKLGRQVVQRLVDPLLGGIYAGSTADASAAAVFPLLLSASQRRASFMRAMRRASGGRAASPGASAPGGQGEAEGGGVRDEGGGVRDEGEAPAFWALRGGLSTLTDRLRTLLADRGVEVRSGTAVSSLERDAADPSGWVLGTPEGPVRADAVVLAVPAGPAADLLAAHDTDAATLLRAIEYSSVAVVTVVFPDDAFGEELLGTGLLVPQGTPLPPGAAERLGADRAETCIVTACTYLWAKWPHLVRPGERVMRASVGRFGDDRFESLSDDELVARVVAELSAMLGLSGGPSSALVTRWRSALPQYRVHHLLRVAGVEAAVKRLGRLAVAGAAYHGVGIPACVASGRAAARQILADLDTTTRAPTPGR